MLKNKKSYKKGFYNRGIAMGQCWKLQGVAMQRWGWSFLWFLTLFLFSSPAIAQGNQREAEMIPSCFLSLGDSGSYALLVEKSTQKLFVYDSHYTLIKTSSVTTGQVSGNKREIDDRRTPEGVYFFTEVMEGKDLMPEYGVMALPLNYPNVVDRKRKKNGSGIWLHATNQRSRPLKPYDTRGCIVTLNDDILDLTNYVELERTPIITVEKIDYNSAKNLYEEQKLLIAFVEQWKDAWEKKDISRYIAAYSKDFYCRDMDRAGWRQYKEGLNESYEFIAVDLQDIKVLRCDGYVVISCLQEYRSDQYQDSGIKRLYLVKETEGWRIIGEEWRSLSDTNLRAIAMNFSP